MKIVNTRHDSIVWRFDPAETEGRTDEIVQFVESTYANTDGIGIRPDTPRESRELMAEFHWQWLSRRSVSPVLQEWAAYLFLAKLDPRKEKSGRPPTNVARNMEITRRVLALTDSGKDEEAAYGEVADEYGLDESTVRRIVGEYKLLVT